MGWGLLNDFLSVPLSFLFFIIVQNQLPIEYHVHIWQLSPQLSCGDTWQIWMCFQRYKPYFCVNTLFHNGKFSERSFCNPAPGRPYGATFKVRSGNVLVMRILGLLLYDHHGTVKCILATHHKFFYRTHGDVTDVHWYETCLLMVCWWFNQAITWNGVHLSLDMFRGIHLKAISNYLLTNLICNINWEIIFLKLLPHPPKANELMSS